MKVVEIIFFSILSDLQKFSTEPTKIGHIFREYVKYFKEPFKSKRCLILFKVCLLKDLTDFQWWKGTLKIRNKKSWKVARTGFVFKVPLKLKRVTSK